jgi:undecaprenyl-diphosphatase
MNSKNKSTNILILLAILSMACFLIFAFWQNPLFAVNESVNMWAANLNLSNGLTQAARMVSEGFDTTVLFVVSLPIAALLFYKKHHTEAFLLGGVMGVDAIALALIKSFVASSRPLNGLIIENGFSFPSGHVTSTIVLFGMLTFLVWQNTKSLSPKIAMTALTTGLATIVALDRIILNVHWLTDVLAAPFLALFLLAVSILALQTVVGQHKRHSNLEGSK